MDLWWPLLFVIGAIAMVLGPVMMLQPNKRQRELTALRQAAAQRGISVRLDSSNRKATAIAVYSLAWPVAVKTDHFFLKKQQFAHNLHFLDYWNWEGDGRPPDNWLSPLKAILQSLPQDITGLEVTEHWLGVFWLEKSHRITLAVIEGLLKKSQTMLLNATVSPVVDLASEPRN